MDIAAHIADSRAALDDLIAAASAAESHWTTPRAPRKWSPAQVTEHVARVFEAAADMIDGKPHPFPKMPFFLKPAFRSFAVNRTLKKGAFPKARTFKPFDPPEGPATPAAARDKLTAAHERYLGACTNCASRGGTFAHSVFGTVPIDDYMRFTTMHTRHHRAQIPTT